MRARHTYMRSCVLGCRYGEVTMDHNGYVVKLPQGVTVEQMLTVPGMVDGDVFDGGLVGVEEKKETQRPPTDDEYFAVIQELKSKGVKLNSEGYVDVGSFNAELRVRGMKQVTGTQRRDIEDKFCVKE